MLADAYRGERYRRLPPTVFSLSLLRHQQRGWQHHRRHGQSAHGTARMAAAAVQRQQGSGTAASGILLVLALRLSCDVM
jgi:hypothetical protein